MNIKIKLTKKIPISAAGARLDLTVARLFPEFSRNHIQQWIREGALTLDGVVVKPRTLIKGRETINVLAEQRNIISELPEDIPLEIIWEDRDLIIINKPAGLVVHPGAGNRKGTLLNGLLNYDKRLALMPRGGIVHRLDKNTSGLMIVTKNELTYLNLIKQLKERSVKRDYLALVVGEPVSGGLIDEPLGRHPKIRTKQSVLKKGKEAMTRYKVMERLGGYSLLKISLSTGRTHQIRVHLSFIGYPIVGDLTYGGRKRLSAKTSLKIMEKIINFKRQALHANYLKFVHPDLSREMIFNSDLPEDISNLLNSLRNERK